MKNLIAAVAVTALAGVAMARPVTVYNTFASYDAAVGGVHSYFEDFEGVAVGDVDGNGNLDVMGNAFNANATYSSPDAGGLSSFVNIADIDSGIDNEIGPMGFWNGRLNAQFSSHYTATGFTGIAFAPTNTIDFFSNGAIVGSASVGGVGNLFDFYGFVSTVPFDSFSLNGTFYAIDAHYGTKIPAPASLGLLGLGALAGRRRR